MIRTLLIDDEYTVTEGLKKLIKWQELGFELVGSAANGIEGIQKIQKLRPDLVIADIRMPGLDGLAMIEKTKEEFIDILFVIMSGYSDFEYAKRALKLGVIDYLEKPATIQKVTQMLERVRLFYDKNCEEKENEKKSHFVNEKSLEKAVLECIYSEKEVQDFEALQEFKKNKSLCIFNGCFKNYQKEDEMRLEKIMRQSILAIGLQIVMVKTGEHFMGVVVGREKEEKKAKWYRTFEKVFKALYHPTNSLYLGIGEVYHDIMELKQSYIEAKSALGYAKFGDLREVVFYHQLMKSVPVTGIGEFDENTLIRNLRVKEHQLVSEQITGYLNSLKVSKVNLRIFEQECLRLIYMGSGVVLEKNKHFKITSRQGMFPHEVLRLCTDYQEVEEWMIEAFKQILHAISCVEEEAGYSAFKRAADYIQQHYTRDISLNEVAEKVGLNPAYFGQLFKEKMGISYVKYITRLRLAYAQRLLDEGYKVVQVSEKVGYINYRYFCDTFKKHLGVTPTQYKQHKQL